MKPHAEGFTPEELSQLQQMVYTLTNTLNAHTAAAPVAPHPMIVLVAVATFAANVVAQFVLQGQYFEWHGKTIDIAASAFANFSGTFATITGAKMEVMNVPGAQLRRKGVARD